MSDETPNNEPVISVKSTRFGELTVPESSIIEIPAGLIGFPRFSKYVMFEHKPPFSWLHSVEDGSLAFVVVDGFEFGKEYDVRPPLGDPDCDFTDKDEYAILVVVTVRPDPRMTTVNLKAPLFVNLRNRRGLQLIIDDQRFSTRHPLWAEGPAAAESETAADAPTKDEGSGGDGSGTPPAGS